MFDGWLDGFFVACAVFVALCATIDWLIGERGRKRMRQRAGDFWLALADKPFRLVIVENIVRTASLIERMFGPRIISWRRLVACVVYSLIVTILASAMLPYIEPVIWKRAVDGIEYGLRKALPLTVAVDYLAIALIVKVYRWAARWPEDIQILTPVMSFVAVGLSTLLAAFAYALGIIVFNAGRCVGDTCDEQDVVVISFFGAFYVLMLTATIPIILHVLHLLMLVMARLFRGVVKPIVMLVLIRLEESQKGVLTTISIAIAAFAKLVQEILKYAGTQA